MREGIDVMKKVKTKLTKDEVRQIQEHCAKLPKGKLKAVVLDPIKGVLYLPIETFTKKGKKADMIWGDPPWSSKSNH
jgi:hypothetical protein